MQFINLTRDIEIGANSYALELAGRTVVIDSGMHPKREGDDAMPLFDCIADRDIDTIFLSHAHLDHVGTLPVLMRRHPGAKVFMTEPTSMLADAILHNSVNVMMRKKEELQLPDYPLFTHREAENRAGSWISIPLNLPCTLDGERLGGNDPSNPHFIFHHAGHILGAASIEFRAEGRRVLYTGDINHADQNIMAGADLPQSDIDTLIIETTRGDSPTEPGWSRENEILRLANTIVAVFERGGSVLIPVFALGKTQELLSMLHEMREQGVLARDTPIYIGGLSTKMTGIYDRFASMPPRHKPHFQILQEVAPYVLAGKGVGSTPIHDGRIYALSSGMMTEKTPSNTFARKFLPEPRHAILFVGYSDPQSPAGKLRSTPQDGLVDLDPDLPSVPKRCQVETFNFSAHGSRESLLNYIGVLRPKKVLLVHGDRPAIEWFTAQTKTLLGHDHVIIPQPGIPIDL